MYGHGNIAVAELNKEDTPDNDGTKELTDELATYFLENHFTLEDAARFKALLLEALENRFYSNH